MEAHVPAPVYRDCEVVRGAVAEELFAKGLCLPSGTAMSEADQMRVVEVIVRLARSQSSEVRRRGHAD